MSINDLCVCEVEVEIRWKWAWQKNDCRVDFVVTSFTACRRLEVLFLGTRDPGSALHVLMEDISLLPSAISVVNWRRKKTLPR